MENESHDSVPREVLEERLRARGLRVTSQRLAVLEYLCSTPSHPTADEIGAAINRLARPEGEPRSLAGAVGARSNRLARPEGEPRSLAGAEGARSNRLARPEGEPRSLAGAEGARSNRAMPTASRASVYNVLHSLRDAGLVDELVFADAVARFDANLDRHHHFVCRGCGKVGDVPWEALPIPPKRRLPDGSTVESCAVILKGLCPPCSLRTGPPAQQI